MKLLAATYRPVPVSTPATVPVPAPIPIPASVSVSIPASALFSDQSSAITFDPSSQLQELCKQLNAATPDTRRMLAPGPSAMMTMQAHASNQSSPIIIPAMASTTCGFTHGTMPVPPS